MIKDPEMRCGGIQKGIWEKGREEIKILKEKRKIMRY